MTLKPVTVTETMKEFLNMLRMFEVVFVPLPPTNISI